MKGGESRRSSTMTLPQDLEGKHQADDGEIEGSECGTRSRLSGFGHEMINNEAGFAAMPDDQVGFR